VQYWNRNTPDLINECVHASIQKRAILQPNALAVCSWDGELSYTQLEEYADRLAAQLVRRGACAGTVLPFCFEKSVWAIVSMVAILKSGAAFLPLNAADPEERIKTLLRESRASFALVSSNQVQNIQHMIEIVVVSEVSMAESLSEFNHLMGPGNAADPAYILFTSGSTGIPKGVVIEHRALSINIAQHAPGLGLGAKSRTFQFASYTFDASITEILSTPVFGGCVCVPSDAERTSDIEGSMRRMEVNFAMLTPSVVHLLSPDNLPSLEKLALVGEAVPRSLINKWSRRLNLLVGYGPTETAIFASIGHLTSQEESGFIGTSVGTNTWIVDPCDPNLLAPIGSVGELVLSGPALAREYLNNPEKTAQAFMAAPFWATHSNISRIYKTGDLAYYRDDGGIMYVRRKDSQVKFHGQRLELGEIEHQILDCLPPHSEAAVDVLRSHKSPSTLRLVAYIRMSGYDHHMSENLPIPMSDDLGLALSNLQERLSERVSAYIVPSIYIPMTTLPKSASGKVDRKGMLKISQALSEEELTVYSLRDMRKHPVSTDTERLLQGIWGSTLGIPIDEIAANDHFFKLGEDSLTAMKVASQLRAGNIFIPVPELFTHPQLSELALLIEGRTELGISTQLPNLLPFELIGDKTLVLERVRACVPGAASTVEDAYPATPLQEALFAVTQATGTAYVNRMVFELPESINVTRFKEAWESVIALTPILRTALINTDIHGTVQVIYSGDITWNEVRGTLQSYLDQDSEIPLDEGQPLTRYGLVFKDLATYFVWTAHHAAYDGWSTGLILKSVHEAYLRLPTEPLAPYVNFIQYLMGTSKEKSDTFWSEQLENFSRIDFPRVPSSAYQSRSNQSFESHIQLPSTVKNNEVTLASIIKAAWALVVSKHSESFDIVFGIAQSGRNAPVHGIERISGPTIATVPVRVRLDLSQRVTQYLHNIHLQTVKMAPYEQAGLRHIRALGKGPAEACKFRNLLVIQPQNTSGFDDWVLPVARHLNGFDDLPLTMECGLGDEGHIVLAAHYDSDLITSFQVKCISNQFRHVLQQLCDASPEKLLSDIEFFTPEDQDLVFKWWNSPTPQTFKACLHDLFELNSLENPQKEAICSWDASFTYYRLDILSTRVAYQLLDAGVKPGSLVPFCFEKSAWAVVSMLAILKAGAAFVPLDPSHPISRLNDIVCQTEATVMLASKTAPTFQIGTTLVVSGDTTLKPATTHATGLLLQKDPSGTAYVIFTSGSTGQPKGVVISHQAVCSSAQMLDLDGIGINSESRVYQFPSYVFDAAIFNIFATLSAGATLCVPSDEDRLGANLARSMHNMRATYCIITGTVSRLFAPEDVPTLRTLMFGGDALYQEDVDRWSYKIQMVQGYGPAEASVFVTWTVMTTSSRPNNVGPAQRARLWIVDPDNHDKLTPVGLAGEMLIEGPSLASGYLNDETNTAAAFISSPSWCCGENRRFYKTGDLVRYADDGSFLFIGRKDSQIKLNGQRVELAEIENSLFSMLPSQRLAVFLLHSGPNKNSLTAVIEATSTDAASNQDLELIKEGTLRERLARQVTEIRETMPSRVPKYMVPRTWFAVGKLPDTTSGKADRKMIQLWLEDMSPHVGRSEALQVIHDAAATVSTTAMETSLQQAIGWALNLPTDNIPLDRSFMALGGDSIASMQLVTCLQTAGIILSVRQVLENKTIKELANLAQLRQQPVQSAKEVTDVPFSLSPIQSMLIDTICPRSEPPQLQSKLPGPFD
jgi:amino acid adenylation domain-containing protein